MSGAAEHSQHASLEDYGVSGWVGEGFNDMRQLMVGGWGWSPGVSHTLYVLRNKEDWHLRGSWISLIKGGADSGLHRNNINYQKAGPQIRCENICGGRWRSSKNNSIDVMLDWTKAQSSVLNLYKICCHSSWAGALLRRCGIAVLHSTFFGLRFFHMTAVMKVPVWWRSHLLRISHHVIRVFMSQWYWPTNKSSTRAATPGRMTEYSRGRKHLFRTWSPSTNG